MTHLSVAVLVALLVAHASCVTHNGKCGMCSVAGSIQNCGGAGGGANDVVQVVPSPSSLMTHNCMVTTLACINITKPITRGSLNYTCTMSVGGRFSGSADICAPEKKLPKQVVDMLDNLNFPIKCPMQPNLVCPTETSKVNLTAWKNYLPMLGTSSCTVNIQVNSGTACLRGNFIIKTFQRVLGG